MAYRVSLTAPAEADAYAAFERIRGRGSPPCREVAHPFIRSLSGLGTLPIRGRVIPEAKELAFPARHLLFGKENGVYRIIFHVQKDEQHMRVLRIWHASRDAITSADVEE
jgi:hypothetical protein